MRDYSVQLEISGPVALWSRSDTMPNPVSYVAPTFSAAKGDPSLEIGECAPAEVRILLGRVSAWLHRRRPRHPFRALCGRASLKDELGRNMFMGDESSSHGLMAPRKLVVFKHQSALGDSPPHQLFDRVVVKLKGAVKA